MLSSLLACGQAFYVPGFSIQSYRDGETIPLFVNKVYSDYSELQYAYSELPFVCPPTGRTHAGHLISGTSLSLNLGEVLRGDRITVSDYELTMGTDEEARYLCSHTVDDKGLQRTKDLIHDGYVAEWIVDNLPGATSFQTTDKTRKYYAAGFKIGEEHYESRASEPRFFLNNHVTLVIRYHRAPGRDGDHGKKVIVGFEVFPKSIEVGSRDADGLPLDLQGVEHGLELMPRSNATNAAGEPVEVGNTNLTIPYTYSVYFRESEHLEWQNRWDMYFVAQDDSSNIHWLAIVNSLAIAAVLTAVVAVIFARTVRGDIKLYKDGALEDGRLIKRARGSRSPRKSAEKGGLLEPMGDDADADLSSDDEALEDVTGWKLVHADVFRAPSFAGLLSPLVGSGTQLIFMAAGLLMLSALGVLNPSFRGGYVSVGIGLFVAAGLFSGYFSSRLYRTFGGQLWQKNVMVVRAMLCFAFATGLTLSDGALDPWTALCYCLHTQSVRLGPSVQHCHPVRHPRWARRPVAADTAAAGVCWRLVRLRTRRSMEPPHQGQLDCAADPRAVVVLQERAVGTGRGLLPLCRRLCRTHVRLQQSVARQERVLLRLWFPRRRQPDLGRDGSRGDHCGCLHAALHRGEQCCSRRALYTKC